MMTTATTPTGQTYAEAQAERVSAIFKAEIASRAATPRPTACHCGRDAWATFSGNNPAGLCHAHYDQWTRESALVAALESLASAYRLAPIPNDSQLRARLSAVIAGEGVTA